MECGNLYNASVFTEARVGGPQAWSDTTDQIWLHCACGASFSVEHELSCPKGGFTILRHNEIRDLTANVLSEVCHNVNVEPALQPLTGEVLSGASAIKDDAARLDIAADGFWGDHRERVYCDVRIFNPLAPSNNQSQPVTIHVQAWKNEETCLWALIVYGMWRVRRTPEVEHGSFTPLEDLVPRIHWIAERSREKDRRVLSQARVVEYGKPDFSAIMLARRL